jgi:hypothetical protein
MMTVGWKSNNVDDDENLTSAGLVRVGGLCDLFVFWWVSNIVTVGTKRARQNKTPLIIQLTVRFELYY